MPEKVSFGRWSVIPAKAGIQSFEGILDSRFRGVTVDAGLSAICWSKK